MNTMLQILKRLAVPASITCFLALNCFAVNVSAQTRAALVRDTDNAALAPASLVAAFSNEFGLYTASATLGTVPAGKRFVVQDISYRAIGYYGQALARGELVGNTSVAYKIIFPVNPVHMENSYTSLQDASFPATAYFEAGEVITVNFKMITSTEEDFIVCVTGYYVSP